MILEAILGFFIDLVLWVVSSILNIVGAPLSGTFAIPKPLFVIAEIAFTSLTAIYPAMFIWFLWRQVKA